MIYKFRTMTDCCDENGCLLPDCDRLTPFGKFLRSTSLDEIPELFNVIKGDMSLVGPRPLLMQYLNRYSSEQKRRHDVKPGLTGWAQINGRNAISWEEKFKLDVWYVDNRSLMLDIKIILLTIKKVLQREGISQDGQATMEEFKGESESCRKQLRQLRIDLADYEKKYGISSDIFYKRFQKGQTDDNMDYIEWASIFQMAKRLENCIALLTDETNDHC
ncbi:hypothetical protein GMMP13_940001 [Candidatus Magnetomoraceae bacterium gMMP-13]